MRRFFSGLRWTDGAEYKELEKLRKELYDLRQMFGEQRDQNRKDRELEIMAEILLLIGFMLSKLKFFFIIFGTAEVTALVF